MTYEDKASYDSTPPYTVCHATLKCVMSLYKCAMSPYTCVMSLYDVSFEATICYVTLKYVMAPYKYIMSLYNETCHLKLVI